MQKYGMITQQKRDELIQNRRNTVYKAVQLANIKSAARHSIDARAIPVSSF
jgi:hypothetical protein